MSRNCLFFKNLTVFFVIIFIISGCARFRHAIPVNLYQKAQIYGMEDIRIFADGPNEMIYQDMVTSMVQESGQYFLQDENGVKVYPVLAISGGSADGAYGAGVLKGWSEHGTRPVFKVVTGISTGAIIAPFAFLGSEYDEKLECLYTSISTRDIMRKRSLFTLFFSNSFASNWPLKRLLDKHIDLELLTEIAKEHAKGRRLYVGTTNLDAQSLVIWDMGRIASFGNKESLKLFRKVILASAAIPVAFPPVFFDVQVEGKSYDEMHVDGGTAKQVFFLFCVLQGFRDAFDKRGIDIYHTKLQLYIIRNGYLNPVWKEIPDKLSTITERTVDTMVNAQGLGDLYRLYIFTENSKGDFNLAYIPSDYVFERKEMFDPDRMKKLFCLGVEKAAQGYPWEKVPPGFHNGKL
ncbi:MAG: patatin-like phospholipase family protein [Candidatus Omnitrophota bacterium]